MTVHITATVTVTITVTRHVFMEFCNRFYCVLKLIEHNVTVTVSVTVTITVMI